MTYENQLQLIFSRMLLALGQMVCNISCFDEIEAALTIIKCYFYYIIYTPVMILWIQCNDAFFVKSNTALYLKLLSFCYMN